VDCRRGAGGGCALVHPPAEISIAQVVRAVQGAIMDVPHVTGSAVSEMWADSSASLEAVLEDVSLEALARRQTDLDERAAAMYYI
jgi:DNA-binding IscR family transcriptional regulator